MLKAPMFFIVCLGSRTGADRSERCLGQTGRKGRRMSAGCSPKAAGARRKPKPNR
jgi:hypothetical protein